MPHQRKSNTGRYNQVTILLPISGLILPKKQTPNGSSEENSLDFHLAMIKKIDNLLQEHGLETTTAASLQQPPIFPSPPTPIEPRLPLNRTLNHTEITWQPSLQPPQVKTETIPDEFKTELTLHPDFKFITSHEFADAIIHIKQRPEDRVEIIDLAALTGSTNTSQFSSRLTIAKNHTQEKISTPQKKEPTTGKHPNRKMEVIDARTLKQKTYEDVFITAAKQNEDIEKKSQIYYLNSKGNKQKKQDVKQTYIPVDFDERSKELKEQHHKEEEQKQQQEEKIRKQLEHEQEKLEKLETKKAKLEEKKHELSQKEKKEHKKETKKEPLHRTIELSSKKQEREQKRLQRLEARTARIEERQRRKKEKQALKEKQKQQHLKQKTRETKQKPQKEKTSSFSLFKKEKPTKQSLELDDDLKKVLLMTDSLLGELPEDVINKFAKSEDFELYERVLNKYKIK